MGDTAAGIIKLLCGKFSFMAGKDFTPELGKVLNSKKEILSILGRKIDRSYIPRYKKRAGK